jgi:hypothetical protein
MSQTHNVPGDITSRIEDLYKAQQALKDTRVLDPDMFQDGVEVGNNDLTLGELIDRMLFGTVDLALRDDMLNKVFHRFYDALPTNEHLSIFRRRFDAEINARWPIRIESFEDLRYLITLGGQDALYQYGDALFYLQQLRREDLEEKQQALKTLQEDSPAEKSELSDQAFEAWIAVVFMQHPGLLNQYQKQFDAQSEQEPDNDPVSDTLASPPVEDWVADNDGYIPDKSTQKDMRQFVESRLEKQEDSSGHAPDYDQDHETPTHDFEQAAEPAAEPEVSHLRYG